MSNILLHQISWKNILEGVDQLKELLSCQINILENQKGLLIYIICLTCLIVFFSFAYIQFTEPDGMSNALALDESLFLGRQIKVSSKRTNKPGISSTNRPPRGRGVRGRGFGARGFRGSRGRPTRRYGFQPY